MQTNSPLQPTTYNLQLVLLFLILALGAFLRFYDIKNIPLGLYPDEAMNGSNALEALETGNWKIFYPENNGREGLFINIQAVSVAAFGNTPWALRVVSAVFGTLTILGVYLVTKELFRGYGIQNNTNIQNSPTSILPLKEGEEKGAGSPFGIFVNHSYSVALLAAFFTATSYWHLNFSRIGFRAIMVPFLASFGLYFLLKGLRRGKILDLVFAGIFIGLGFHTYIAFRFMPFVLAVPILWYLWKWFKGDANDTNHHPNVPNRNANDSNKIPPNLPFSKGGNSPFAKGGLRGISCAPCGVALFLFVTFVTALPVGYYFFTHPEDFVGRGGQVSIFAAEAPIKEFIISKVQTIGMFFYAGDCNWRHNYNCQPELHPIVAVLFAVGIVIALWTLMKRTRNLQLSIINYQSSSNTKISNSFENSELPARRSIGTGGKIENLATLLAWLILMSLPSTLTREGLPHALRAIGMIPPVMIFAGFGAWKTLETILALFEKQKAKYPQYLAQLARIQREIAILFVTVLLFVPIFAYKTYFVHWAENRKTFYSFATDLLHIGEYINTLPRETKKYVVVNMSGTEVRGIPMPAQTVMYITDTFTEKGQKEKNVVYTIANRQSPIFNPEERVVILFLNGEDRGLIAEYQKKFPEFHPRTPGDFVILEAK